jgi:hypothetical protein
VIVSNSKNSSPSPKSENTDVARPGSRAYLVVKPGTTPGDIMAEARAAGRENLPRSDAQEISGPEDTIRAEHERQHIALTERTRGRLADLVASFSTIEQLLPGSHDLAAVVDDAEAKVRSALSDERLLVPERRAQQRGLRDLNHLVDTQQITRPPRYPKSKRLHLAWVAVLATIEAVANSAFFAEISSIGLLGGLVSALGIAVLNTASAVLVGYGCLRGLHHHHSTIRRLSALALAAYLILIVAFNLAVGHARDLATAGVLTSQGFSQLLRHPFTLSLLSAALVGLGLVSVTIALATGRSLDELIPSYGPIHRRFVGAERTFAQSSDALRSQVMAHVHAVPERLRAEVRRARQLLDQLELTVVGADKTVVSYETGRQHLEADCARLLREFRSANERVRSTRPPSYFREFPEFASRVDARPVHALKQRLTAAHYRLDELKVAAHRLEAEQPERVRDAGLRFEHFYEGQLHRADAGRGDPSEDGRTWIQELQS